MASTVTAKRVFWSRLPVVRELRQSVGWQRGMLVGGLVIIAIFLLTAAFASLLAPYGFSQLSDENGCAIASFSAAAIATIPSSRAKT